MYNKLRSQRCVRQLEVREAVEGACLLTRKLEGASGCYKGANWCHKSVERARRCLKNVNTGVGYSVSVFAIKRRKQRCNQAGSNSKNLNPCKKGH